MLFPEKQSLLSRIKHQFFITVKVPVDALLRKLGSKSLPEVIIIGAQKSGTSALFNYMSQHPELLGSYKKETHYFDSLNYDKGISWYARNFPPVSKNIILFEATPSYIYRNWCAERIYRFNKNVKLIAVLREPLSRAFSAWNMARQVFLSERRDTIVQSSFGIQRDDIKSGMTNLLTAEHFKNFSECVKIEMEIINSGSDAPVPNFIRRGIYVEQLNKYFKFFNKEQVLIIDHNNLLSKPEFVLRKIEDFIGVNNIDWSDKDMGKKHIGSYNSEIDNATKNLLNNFYHPLNQQLFDLIGQKFDW